MIVGLLVFGWVGQESTVTLPKEVALVPALLGEIQRQSGLVLRYRPDFKNTAMFLALKPKPVSEVLKLVAQVAAGQWEKSGDGYTLTRPASLKRKLQEQELQDRTREFADQISRELKFADLGTPAGPPSDNPVTTPDDDAKFYAGMLDNPAGKALNAIMKAVPVREWALLPNYRRWDWSTAPTQMQRQLPIADAPKIVERFEADWAELGHRLDALSPEEQGKLLNGLRVRSGQKLQPSGDVVMRVSVDRQFRSLASINLQIGWNSDAQWDVANLPLSTSTSRTCRFPADSSWRSRPFEFSGDDMELGGPPTTAVSPAMMEKLSRPTRYEPLGLLMNNGLRQLADATGCEVVAEVPDPAGSLAYNLIGQKQTLGDWMDEIDREMVWRVGDGMLIGEPSDALEGRTGRMDREIFEKSTPLFKNSGLPRLEPWTNYAREQGDIDSGVDLEATMRWALGSKRYEGDLLGSMLTDLARGSRDTLRLYAMLSPPQRAALQSGGTIQFSALSPEVADLLESMTFARAVSLQERRPRQRPGAFGMPSELLPNGLPANGSLSATVSNQRVAYVTHSEPQNVAGGAQRCQDLAGLGYIMWMQDQGLWLDGKMGYINVRQCRFLPATRRSIRLSVNFGDGLSLQESLYDYATDGSGEGVAIGDLPPDYGADVQKVYDYYAKSGFNPRNPGRGTTAQP